MRFDVNAPKPHYLTPESEKGAFYVGGLLLPREVFWKCILSQKPQFATVRLSMWKGAPNNAEGKGQTMHWGDDVLLLYLAPFFKTALAKMRKFDTRCESKQECSSSKADELKVEFSAEWLRIWRYERGISNKTETHNALVEALVNTLVLGPGNTTFKQ